jgi:hypothetical protein
MFKYLYIKYFIICCPIFHQKYKKTFSFENLNIICTFATFKNYNTKKI